MPEGRGILGVTRGGVALVAPPDDGPANLLRYGLAVPMQVGPRTVALVMNIRKGAAPGSDFEAGGDVVLMDDLDHQDARKALAVDRNEEVINPKNRQPCLLTKGFPIGGFVPLGARRPDGSPHPHAGTGFGLVSHLSFPQLGKHNTESLYNAPDRFSVSELMQFEFDGKTFRTTDRRRIDLDTFFPAVTFMGGRLLHAIPDGDDLLHPTAGQRTGYTQGSGLLRWRHGRDGWRPVAILQVTGGDRPYEIPPMFDDEPSCIRDVDGALLFSYRRFGWETETRKLCHDLVVYRSADGGARWQRIITVPNVRAESPVTIGQAADGTPYLCGNLHVGSLVLGGGGVSESGVSREILCLWPLNAARTGLESHYVVRDTRADFGPPPNGSMWRADHPIGVSVRLRDGRWHGLLTYRVMEDAEYTGAQPTPWTGCYIEEVLSAGNPCPAWNFDENAGA